MYRLKEYLAAGYPALYLKTLEPARAIETLTQEVTEMKGIPVVWDLHQGMIKDGRGEACDALEVLQQLSQAPENTTLFAWNYHYFLQGIEIIQGVQNRLDEWKSKGQSLIVVAPAVKIPLELERIFTLLSFELPERTELHSILKMIADSAKKPMPENEAAILDIAKGLTTFEAENAFALAASSPNGFSAKIITEQKAQIVKKNASIEIHSATEGFEKLGGLKQLKNFASKIARSPLARGLLLLGVPGCGKSHFAKALGGELGIPTLLLDFGQLFGSLVGQSEERIRQALAVADAMAPCVLMIDEIDKGLSGVGSSHQSDGGVGSRIFGTFLTWLNDHRSQVFTVATTNNIAHLPPEFLRAERWDAIFFVDLPTKEERNAILEIHSKEFDIEISEMPDITNWSGAEIRSLCRIGAMMDIPMKEAAQYITPLSKSMGKQLTDLREWAASKTIPASIPVKPASVRKISRPFHNN